jgi:hypothetical protein
MELERAVLSDDYFIERKLYPSIDFYSGIIFRALGLPLAMFTPAFAMARTVGWVAHWNEVMTDPETRLSRPRQLYCGPTERPLLPVAERATHAALVGCYQRPKIVIECEAVRTCLIPSSHPDPIVWR